MHIISAACAAALVLLAGTAQAAEPETFSYANQEKWVGVLDHAQSPIDIVTAQVKPAEDNEPREIVLRHAGTVEGEAVDTGHAVEFKTHSTEATIRGRHFRLQQLHFHDESEHTIDGKHFPLEGHFVFAAQDGRLAVLAVMYEQGAPNQAIQTILDELGPKPTPPDHARQQMLNIQPLLPPKMAYFHYVGSLTTPPLTQNVEWYVLRQRVALSPRQLEALRAHDPRNNRGIQPLNGRPVTSFPG